MAKIPWSTDPPAAKRVWEESRAPVRHDADFRHHASVLMFEYMAVVDEVANLLEWDFNNHSTRFAGPGAPGVYRPIASRSVAFEIRAVRHRHIVEQGVSIENVDGYFLSIGARRRDQAETGLMNMEVMVFAGEVDQFPYFFGNGITRLQRQADRRIPGMVESFDLERLCFVCIRYL